MKEYIVFDLEWNQSPYGKGTSVEALPFEVIELGAVKLNGQMEKISDFRCLVRPQVYEELHYKISEVVHRSMDELLEKGIPFPKAVEEFIAWCGEHAVFCTWGSMDLTELQRNMAFYQMDSPFPFPLLYYDVQKLYAMLRKEGKERISLDAAVHELGIREDRPFHQAFDDACYTAEVMKAMDWQNVAPYLSIDYYRLPRDKKEEVLLRFPNYDKYVSRPFDTKEEAIADRKVADMVCCECRRTMRKKIRWFPSGQRAYLCLASCQEHGLYKGKIRMKKTEQGQIFAVKTVKPVHERKAAEISIKKEESRKKRSEKNRQRKLEKKKRKELMNENDN